MCSVTTVENPVNIKDSTGSSIISVLLQFSVVNGDRRKCEICSRIIKFVKAVIRSSPRKQAEDLMTREYLSADDLNSR